MEGLKEYSMRIHEQLQAKRSATLGIACDLCGGELMRPEPHEVLLSFPAQIRVHCVGCGFNGYAPML